MAGDIFDDIPAPTPTKPKAAKTETVSAAVLKDRFGRTFNPKLHTGPTEVDESGFLVVRRREPTRSPMGASLILKDTLAMYEESGYEYRWVNRKPGRQARFESADWEPVMDNAGGQVTLAVNPRTGAQSGAADAVLMRKPTEWAEMDRAAAQKARRVELQAKTEVPDDAKELYKGLTVDRDVRIQ